MSSISTQDGSPVLSELIAAIQANKQYLSDIDGLIGDGDHGINMNKGFTLCEEQLKQDPGDLSHGLKTLGTVLMTQIGGSMGPLYGTFFRAMAKACKGQETLDAETSSIRVAVVVRVIPLDGHQHGQYGEVRDGRVAGVARADEYLGARGVGCRQQPCRPTSVRGRGDPTAQHGHGQRTEKDGRRSRLGETGLPPHVRPNQVPLELQCRQDGAAVGSWRIDDVV